jgi:hypothetical protein
MASEKVSNHGPRPAVVAAIDRVYVATGYHRALRRHLPLGHHRPDTLAARPVADDARHHFVGPQRGGGSGHGAPVEHLLHRVDRRLDGVSAPQDGLDPTDLQGRRARRPSAVVLLSMTSVCVVRPRWRWTHGRLAGSLRRAALSRGRGDASGTRRVQASATPRPRSAPRRGASMCVEVPCFSQCGGSGIISWYVYTYGARIRTPPHIRTRRTHPLHGTHPYTAHASVRAGGQKQLAGAAQGRHPAQETPMLKSLSSVLA